MHTDGQVVTVAVHSHLRICIAAHVIVLPNFVAVSIVPASNHSCLHVVHLCNQLLAHSHSQAPIHPPFRAGWQLYSFAAPGSEAGSPRPAGAEVTACSGLAPLSLAAIVPTAAPPAPVLTAPAPVLVVATLVAVPVKAATSSVSQLGAAVGGAAGREVAVC